MKPLRVLVLSFVLVICQTSFSRAQIASAASGLPRLDKHGAPLPAGAIQRLRDSRHNHLFVNAIAVSPDGRSVALAHNDGVIYVWNLASAEETRRLVGHQKAVAAVAYAPDGGSLASASDDGTVRIWDAATGKQRRCFTRHGKPVTSVAYAPDGSLLASGGHDNRVLLWEVGTGKILRELNAGQRVNSVAFSADGQTLAAGTYYLARLWSAPAGMDLFRFGVARSTVNAVAFSPDGRTLAAASDRDSIDLLEVATGELIRRLRQDGYVKCVAFSPDGRTLASAAAAGKENGPCLWDVPTGQVLRQLTGVADPTLAVAFTPDGKTLISGGRDSTALVWPNVRGDKQPKSHTSLTTADLDEMWEDLQDAGAAEAHKIIWHWVACPEVSVAYLRRKLRPAEPVPWSPELIAKLDSSSFQEREKAMAQLERLPDALPELEKASLSPASGEVSRRLELILRKLTTSLAPERLRTMRALQILEQIGDAQARAVLKVLAGGAPGARLTHEARAALKRLDLRAAAAGAFPSHR